MHKDQYELIGVSTDFHVVDMQGFQGAMIAEAKRLAPDRWKRSCDYQVYAGDEGLYRLAEDIAWLQIGERNITFKNFLASLGSPFLCVLAQFATGYIDVREITSFEHYRLHFVDGALIPVQGMVTVTYPEPSTFSKDECHHLTAAQQ